MRTTHPLVQQAAGLQALVCERAAAAERAGGPAQEDKAPVGKHDEDLAPYLLLTG